MYAARPTTTIKQRLNRYASTILLGGVFFTFSVMLFMAMCKMPCEHARLEKHLMESINDFHEGHSPVKRLSQKETTDLIVLVISAPNNTERRSTIRETWLWRKRRNVMYYFVIASANLDISTSKAVQLEQSQYQDLLLLPSMRDSYKYLTTKVLHSFLWIYSNIDFKYVLKVDDDSFVIIPRILSELKQIPADRLYWGFFDGRANVKKSGQWAETNWILCDKYLPHARGGGYLLSYDLIAYIAMNSDLLQLFNSEDISVGTWLAPLKINRIHDPRFDTEYASRGCSNDFIVTHKQTSKDMTEKWASLQSSGDLCKREIKLRPSYNYNWKVLPSMCCIRNDSNVP